MTGLDSLTNLFCVESWFWLVNRWRAKWRVRIVEMLFGISWEEGKLKHLRIHSATLSSPTSLNSGSNEMLHMKVEGFILQNVPKSIAMARVSILFQ